MSNVQPLFSNSDAPGPATGERLSRDEARRLGRIRAEEKRKKAEQEAAQSAQAPVTRPGREHDVEDGTGQYKMVLIDDLAEDPDNPRKVMRDVAALAENIKTNGMLQPIVARITQDGKLVIRYGHRRYRAARMLNWQRVPVIIRYGIKDPDALADQLAENVARAAMDPMDEARALRAFMRKHALATYQQAADKLGLSVTWVSNRANLISLSEQDQERVSEGKLTITEAVQKSRRTRQITRTPRTSTPQHFSDEHSLASRARARCRKGTRGHTPLIGGVACGECWEAIIRIDAIMSVNNR